MSQRPTPPPSPPPAGGMRSPHAVAGASPEPATPGKSNLGKVPAGLQRTGSETSVASSTASGLHGSPPQALRGAPQQQSPAGAAEGGGGGSDNIKVVVRVRPLFPPEASKGASNVVQISDDASSMKVIVPGPGGTSMQREFAFHACLGPDTGQAEVMQLCGIHQLLDAALAGYHVTIFAYGQTGSGKTHTMSGREDAISDDTYQGDEEDGIVSRSVRYLFHQVHTRKDAKYSLKASYVEIYNENVFDLIHFKQKSLPVKWDANYGFYVQGLKVVPCGQSRTMMEVIRTGMKHRRVGSHQLNMESSRSHSIMTVYCDATPTDPSSYDYGTVRYGKLSFVDLAGSERVKDSKSEGTMLKETININKSLLVLGKVISTLAENDAVSTTAHVPYRDSKLTKLLMDSLGGSALTLMIACCSPSSLQVDETLSTLLYATRAKNIHNRPTVQYDPREAQISLLRREIELLRQENVLLREQLRGGGGQGTPPAVRAASPAPGSSGAGPAALQRGQQQQAVGAVAGSPRASVAAGLEDLAAADELVTGLRANSNPQLAAGSTSLRSSLNDSDLRSLRTASGSGGAVPMSPSASGAGSEMLRRLKETQALLVKFSEENGRLARENDKLRAGRNALSTEHATVLDEIDLLRSKLSQLEHSVLTAAATPGSGGAGGGGSAAGGPGTPNSTAATASMRALLASLGLDEVAGSLPSIGAGGPMGELMALEGGEGGEGLGADDASEYGAAAEGGMGSDRGLRGMPAGGFGSPVGSSSGAGGGGDLDARKPRTSRSAPDGGGGSFSGQAGLVSAAWPPSPAAGGVGAAPLSAAAARPAGVAAVAKSLTLGARAGGLRPAAGGGSGAGSGAGSTRASADAGGDGIYVADEAKLAVLLGPSPGVAPASPAAAGRLQQAVPRGPSPVPRPRPVQRSALVDQQRSQGVCALSAVAARLGPASDARLLGGGGGSRGGWRRGVANCTHP